MSVVTNAVRTRGSQQNLFGVFYRHGNRLVCSSFSTNWNGYSNRSNEGHCGFQWTSHRFFRSSAVFLKKKSYYDVLGVGKSATKEEIKSKYREMAKKCHPDLNRDDKSAEEKFKEITAAYEVLENDAKRQTYDNYGIDGVEHEESGGGRGRSGGFDGFEGFSGFDNFQGTSADDFFSMFNNMHGRENGKYGKDVSVKLRLTFLEAVHGCTKELKYDIGSSQQRNKRGKPKAESKTRTVDVHIPAGVDSGMTVQMDGQGCPAKQGNHVGNLIIELTVDKDKDKYFKREKSDVHTDLHITIDQAILGSSADVRTLDGAVTMKINPGTQPGSTFSITGKGISKVNSASSRRGNHYVKVVVTIPSEITEKQRELLLEFAKEASKVKEGIGKNAAYEGRQKSNDDEW